MKFNPPMKGVLFAALLVLGYGPLNWTFPWWVWTLAILSAVTFERIFDRKILK